MYPIAIIGNSNRCGPDWAAGYAEGFGEGKAQGYADGMHAQMENVNNVLDIFHPMKARGL